MILGCYAVGKKPPTLPKGLPAPPTEPTTYLVYIARKQWVKVAEAIQVADDKLIVEGYPVVSTMGEMPAAFACCSRPSMKLRAFLARPA